MVQKLHALNLVWISARLVCEVRKRGSILEHISVLGGWSANKKMKPAKARQWTPLNTLVRQQYRHQPAKLIPHQP
jgi:hypothetical protein